MAIASRPQVGVLTDVAVDSLLGVLEYADMGEDQETFAERVARLRKRTGLSQMRFAEKAGLSREGYQKIEQGESEKPDLQTVRKIARAADLKRVGTLSRMLGWIPIEEADADWLAGLSDDDRDMVLELVDRLKPKAESPPGAARQQRAARS